MIEYYLGMKLKFIHDSRFDQHKNEIVTVELLKKRGGAKLSNGWTVDEDGIAEGTQRIPGGQVVEI